MTKYLLVALLLTVQMMALTITEDTTLSEDTIYNEDIIINGKTLNLNGHTLTVNGNLNITGEYSRLQMTNSSDKLVVTGNLTFEGASTYNDLTKGVIEL